MFSLLILLTNVLTLFWKQGQRIVKARKTKSDILERTSQRGSTFIYVPQKRGTPLIGSNVATVLCFHKKLTSSISLGFLCVSSNHALSSRKGLSDLSLWIIIAW